MQKIYITLITDSADMRDCVCMATIGCLMLDLVIKHLNAHSWAVLEK